MNKTVKAVMIPYELRKNPHMIEIPEPLHLGIRMVIGGWMEIVRPVGLDPKWVMIVNETGRLDGLPKNYPASILYGCGLYHYEPIVGNAVIMKEGFVDGEPDIIGLDDNDIQYLLEALENLDRTILEGGLI